jgi:hypothetical protein
MDGLTTDGLRVRSVLIRLPTFYRLLFAALRFRVRHPSSFAYTVTRLWELKQPLT